MTDAAEDDIERRARLQAYAMDLAEHGAGDEDSCRDCMAILEKVDAAAEARGVAKERERADQDAKRYRWLRRAPLNGGKRDWLAAPPAGRALTEAELQSLAGNPWSSFDKATLAAPLSGFAEWLEQAGEQPDLLQAWHAGRADAYRQGVEAAAKLVEADDAAELRPCPFCGREASFGNIRYDPRTVKEQGWKQDTFHYGSCQWCASNNRGLVGFDTKEQAAAHWNRRVNDGLRESSADRSHNQNEPNAVAVAAPQVEQHPDISRAIRALKLIEHATAPGSDDAYHENAHTLAIQALSDLKWGTVDGAFPKAGQVEQPTDSPPKKDQ